MNNNDIACIYMTHNHPEIMEKVLKNIYDNYDKHGIDIYIYDSSLDFSTENIVNDLVTSGANNIYYVDMRMCENADEKYVYMLKQYGLINKYRYIWNSKDRCYFEGETLDRIVNATKNDYDIIFATSELERWELRYPDFKDEYTNPALFYSHYGHLATNWECLIRKVDTMIDGIDMDKYSTEYRVNKDNPFNQTVSLFVRLSEMESVRIKVLRDIEADRRYIMTVSSGWISRAFEIWIDKWIIANEILPDIYESYKWDIIKAETYLPQLFGSVDGFRFFKKEGAFSFEVYEKYRYIWDKVTDLNPKYIEMISQDKEADLWDFIIGEFLESFTNNEYDRSYRIFQTNVWFESVFGKKVYEDLDICFKVYKNEINEKGYSILFEGCDSLEKVLIKYYSVKT